MTFETQGFLSQDIETWRKRFVEKNSEWFGIAARVNEVAQKLAFSAHTKDGGRNAERRLLAGQLFVRVLSSFQGAILMAERGMTVEARTLVRGCLESTFILGALHDDDYEIVKIMLHADYNSRRTLAYNLSRNAIFRGVVDANTLRNVDSLADAAAKPCQVPKLSYKELAEKGGMEGLYDIYKQLSADAAHPTVTSLSRHLDPDERDTANSVVCGPDGNVSELIDTISLALNILLGACMAFNQTVENPDANDALRAVFEELCQLHKRNLT